MISYRNYLRIVNREHFNRPNLLNLLTQSIRNLPIQMRAKGILTYTTRTIVVHPRHELMLSLRLITN